MFLRLPPPMLLIIATLCWAGHWVVARATISEVSPFALSFWRWCVASVVLAPFAFAALKAQRHLFLSSWKVVLALSLTGTGIYNGVGYIGIQSTAATNALLIQAMAPAFIPSVAFLILGERTRLVGIVGLAVSFFGVLIIASKLDLEALRTLNLNRGDLWVMLNVVFWALYTLALRFKPSALDSLALLFILAATGAIQSFPFYVWEVHQGAGVHWNSVAIGGILFLGCIPSVFAYLAWNRAVAVIGPAGASPYLYLTPVFGISGAWLLLGERLQDYHVVGIAFILSGVWLASKKRLQQDSKTI